MAEYIEREAVRLAIFNTHWQSFVDVDTAYDMVDGVPDADVVPVVRCDNCRNMKLLDGAIRFCKIWNAPNGMGADGFCSYGERKDGDG